MMLDKIVEAIKTFPGVTRKHTIHEIVKYLPTNSFANIAANEGEDAAAIEYGDNYLLFAADGIMESLLKINPFYAGYFAVLVNINDIAAMGGRALAMVDVMSVKDERICSQILKGMEYAVKKFNVPIVGGHTHPDCQYHAIDISIIGTVPKADIILSSTAKCGDDIIFAMDTYGFFPPDLKYAYDTTTNKEDKLVRSQIEAMHEIASKRLVHAAKDISNPGCIGTMGMLLESSGKGGCVDIDKIPVPSGNVDLIQWILSYQGYGFVLSCSPKNSQEVIDIFKNVECEGAIVGKVNDSQIFSLKMGTEEKILFDFNNDIITGCNPIRKLKHQ
ncbi:MAG: methanogenesis marker 2 protein [archaeon]|nr:methanogenesis marker 2 protein [archaeon]